MFHHMFTRVHTRTKTKRVWIPFLGKKILLFAQIRAASPSGSHDGHLFHEAHEQDKFYIFIRTFKLRDEWGYPGRRLRSPYTVVNGRIRSFYDRIRPYFAVLHGPVLRSYISVTVYGGIRSYTGKYGAKRRSYTDSVYKKRKRPFFSPFISVFHRIRHGDIRP